MHKRGILLFVIIFSIFFCSFLAISLESNSQVTVNNYSQYNESDLTGIKADFLNLGEIVMNPGDTKSLGVSIKNTGTSFLNGCKLVSEGQNSDWFTSKSIKGLAAGEIGDFIFTIESPYNISPGDYYLNLTLVCKEGTSNNNLKISILNEGLKLAIKEINEDEGGLNISYTISDLSGKQQEVNLNFILEDKYGNEIKRGSKSIYLGTSEEKKDNYVMSLEDNLAGDYKIIINADSNLYSTSTQDSVLFGKKDVTGFALLSQQGQKVMPIVVVTISFVVIFYFVMKRVIKSHKIIQGQDREIGFVKVRRDDFR